MTAPAIARPMVGLVARPSWPRAAGIASSIEALTDTMYFVSTGAQIIAGLLIARMGTAAAK